VTDDTLIIDITLSGSGLLMLLAYGAWLAEKRQISNVLTKILQFLDRPNGGVEVETIYCLSELWFALIFTLSAQVVLNMSTTEGLYWAIPHYVIAIPWWLSSAATLIGLVLYLRGNKWCAPLRWFGAFVSAWIWSMMFARGAVETGGALGTLAFYFFGAVWQIRIMMSAWRRWGAWRLHASS
jgi:hypothetical protein